jgi:UTP--glucose-1-phosphate uridylyltransferase
MINSDKKTQKPVKKLQKAIFPVGGLGTRFLPATKALPKEMLPVAAKPLIQYAFEEAVKAGIEEFIFVTGRNKNTISNHFDHSYELQSILSEKTKREELALTKDWLPEAGRIAFIRQQAALGLGHAVWCARHFIGDEPFAIILADEMLMTPGGFLTEMKKLHDATGGNIVAIAEIDKAQSASYGIIDPKIDQGNYIEIKNMVEKPHPLDAPSNMAIVGRYILQPEIFNHLAKAEPGTGGEIQLTDAMKTLNQDQQFLGLKFNGPRFDCGNQLGLLEANIAYTMANDTLREGTLKMLSKYVGPK